MLSKKQVAFFASIVTLLLITWFALPVMLNSRGFQCVGSASAQSECQLIEATSRALISEVQNLRGTVTAMEGGNNLQAQSLSTLMARYAGIPFDRTDDGAFILGDEDAPIHIVEFSDFLCFHCWDYAFDVMHPFVEEYVATGRVVWEYRMYPVIDANNSAYGMKLAECADEQGDGYFWLAHDVMYELASTMDFNEDQFAQILAYRLDINVDELVDCVSDASQYETDYAVGRDSGVTGTPAILVRNEDGDLDWITVDNVIYNRGGIPLEVLTAYVESVLEDE